MKKRIYRRVVLVVILLVIATSPAGARGERPSLIRDAEIEHTIREFATPLFNAAGLTPQSIRIYIVGDDALNAFVAGGPNIFITTGLLLRAETPAQLMGVLAHETGHIAGGHLSAMGDRLRDATTQTILSYILGAAAAVATGDSRAAGAVISGGQAAAERSFLSFSRTQEAAADQAAFTYLERSHLSARGLYEFLDILGDQDLLNARRRDPYARTHPLSRERLSYLEQRLANSPYTHAEDKPRDAQLYRRMQAKLFGFLNSPARTLERYPEADVSPTARLARAVAYYRQPDLAKALPLVDGLINEAPEDAYYRELLGQILFENGRTREAIAAYGEAVRLDQNAPLLAIGLAQAQIELGDAADLPAAITHLTSALRREPDNTFAWRLIAVAYGKTNQMGMAALALAEEALIGGRKAVARGQANRAIELLAAGEPARLRAEDIKRATEEER